MSTPPPAILVRDLPVFPYERPWIGGPEIARIPAHGRIRKRTAKVSLDDFPAALLDQPRTRLSGRYLYGGPLYHHFGHVLVDSIIRLWAYDPAVHTDGVIFPLVLNAYPTHPEFFFEICRGFGIERDRIHIIDTPMTVEAVHFAEPGSVMGSGPEPWYPARLESVERFFLDSAPADLKTYDRLFFGRRHLCSGSLMGEGYFAARLARRGFHDIQPERYPLPAQIRLLKAAREIVFTEGSAIHLTELTTALSAERITIILRRPMGDFALRPHLDARLRRPADVVGRGAGLFRIHHQPESRAGPNSLSYMGDPSAVYDDLVGLGYAEPGGFDLHDFVRAERIEQAQCVGANPEDLAGHIAKVAQERLKHGLATPELHGSRPVLAQLRSLWPGRKTAKGA